MSKKPSKLTTERMNAIVERIEKGVPQNAAGALEGIARSTLYNWLRQGARDYDAGKTTTLHARLWLGVQRGDAKAFAAYLESMDGVVNNSTTPAAARLSHMQWWAEQRFRRHLGQFSTDMLTQVEQAFGEEQGGISAGEGVQAVLDSVREAVSEEQYKRILRDVFKRLNAA